MSGNKNWKAQDLCTEQSAKITWFSQSPSLWFSCGFFFFSLFHLQVCFFFSLTVLYIHIECQLCKDLMIVDTSYAFSCVFFFFKLHSSVFPSSLSPFYQVSIELPQLKLLKNVVDKMKNLNNYLVSKWVWKVTKSICYCL